MAKYEYDDCTFCGGRVTERRSRNPVSGVTNWLPWLMVYRRVSASNAGERYYKAAVLKRIEANLKTRSRSRQIRLPVIEYSART